MTTEDKKILVFGLVGTWLLCWLFLPKISVATGLLTVVVLSWRKSKAAWLALLLNPYVLLSVLGAGQGAVDYWQGNARLQGFGYPSDTAYNVDPEFRLGKRMMGCVISIPSSLKSEAYNKTVKTLVQQVGFQEGAYLGPFPTATEARKMMQSEIVSHGLCRLQGEHQLQLSDPWNDYLIELDEQVGMIRQTISPNQLIGRPPLVVLENHCMVAQLNDTWIYVIDVKEQTVLAQYRTEDPYAKYDYDYDY